MNGYDYERMLFRRAKQQSKKPRSGVPLITSLIQRGEEAMWEDDWISAENCYIAAYFINGGAGEIIRSKIEMVQQIIEVSSIVDAASARVESARYARPMLKIVIDELEHTLDTLLMLRMELPHSERLMQMEGTLDRVLRGARKTYNNES